MDYGFSASDDLSPLEIAGGGQFFLIRLPRDVDVDILQGRKLNIKPGNESDKIVDQVSRDSKLFNIRLDHDVELGYCNTVRPVIKSSLGESSCLGPVFSGILSVEQSFSQLLPAATGDIPITAYRKLNQVPNLCVRSTPRGSHSTISELLERRSETATRQKSSGGSGEGSGKKKRKSEGGSASKEKEKQVEIEIIHIKDEVIKEEEVEKAHKKHKKDKKDKKEHKEHRSGDGHEKKEKKHKKDRQ